MYVGDCNNGVHFIKGLPHEITKVKDFLPVEGNELDSLLLDISLKMRGTKVLRSGYAVMWQWSSTPTEFFVIVWKELPGVPGGSNTTIGRVVEV